MTSAMHQIPEGAVTYKYLSSQIQNNVFKRLLSTINIEEGWKVMDFGCGTGNGTSLLADIVGPKGYVCGTDPIMERIELAKHNYQRENLAFHVGYGRDSQKFGTNFDLITSSFVMHWLPYEEKLLTFKNVSECVRSGGPGFHFVTTTGEKVNSFGLFKFLPEKITNDTLGNVYFENGENYKKIASENGFDEVSYEEFPIELPFKSLDESFKWFAATFHKNNYETFLKCLREIPKKHDVGFMYNDEGKVVYSDVCVFVRCKKHCSM